MWRTNLAEDMEMDILLRLPVKSLLRFRCVSKSWCTRFQTQLFITNHYLKQTSLHKTNNYANVSVLVLCENGRQIGRIRPWPPTKDPPYFSLLDHTLNIKQKIHLPLPKHDFIIHPIIMGPCNGLMCLWYPDHNQITLWNPATREFKHLPESQIQRPPNAYRTQLQACGFGFDTKTDDYKVICIFKNSCDDKMIQQVDVYTLSTDSWRGIDVPVEFESLVYHNPRLNTYINGVFHWEFFGAKCIIAFDMANEFFSTLPLPNLSFSYLHSDLGLLNGYLAVFNYPKLEEDSNFDIWVMREYGMRESWTKLLKIGPIFGSYMPLEFWKNGQLFLKSHADQQHLVLYDPITQEIEKLQVHSRNRFTSFRMRVVIYVESLVPINRRRENEDERFIRFPTQVGDA